MKNKNLKNKSGKGFTLIELLVVVAILGVLATITMVSLSDARARSRDARRVQDMKTLQDALALYQTRVTLYPDASTAITINGTTDVLSLALKSEGSMSSVPVDPLNRAQGGVNYFYTYQSLSSRTSYAITYCLETSSIKGMTAGCGKQISP